MRSRHVPARLVALSLITLLSSPSRAQPQPLAAPGPGENAALRYWQAFAHLPKFDEAQQKLLAAPPAAGRADAKATELVASGRDALLYLRRGAAIGACDWGLHPEDGPHLLLPHLAKGRDLARLASLNARLDFAKGDNGRAVDHAADAIVLGRHLSTDLTAMISYLVQLAVERNAIETLAPHLGGLDAASLDRLERRMAALPAGGTLEQCMRVERASFLEWAVAHLGKMKDQDPWREKVLAPFAAGDPAQSKEKLDAVVAASGGTRAGVLEQFEALRPLYDELGPMVQLPRDEFRAKFAALQDRAKNNPLASEVLPAMTRVYDKDGAGRTRMTLLRAAVAVARGGPERAKEYKDATGAPVEYQATADGFELRTKVMDEESAVMLKVGGKKGQ